MAGMDRKGWKGRERERRGSPYVIRRGPSRVRCPVLRLRGTVRPFRGILGAYHAARPTLRPERLRARFQAVASGNCPGANSPRTRANPLRRVHLGARAGGKRLIRSVMVKVWAGMCCICTGYGAEPVYSHSAPGR